MSRERTSGEHFHWHYSVLQRDSADEAQFPAFLGTVRVRGAMGKRRGHQSKTQIFLTSDAMKRFDEYIMLRLSLFHGDFWAIYSNQRPLFLQRSCTVQHSQLTVLTSTGRLYTGLVARRTRRSHLHRQMEELEGFFWLHLICLFGELWPSKESQNVRPQRMFFLHRTGEMRCLR